MLGIGRSTHNDASRGGGRKGRGGGEVDALEALETCGVSMDAMQGKGQGQRGGTSPNRGVDNNEMCACASKAIMGHAFLEEAGKKGKWQRRAHMQTHTCRHTTK